MPQLRNKSVRRDKLCENRFHGMIIRFILGTDNLLQTEPSMKRLLTLLAVFFLFATTASAITSGNWRLKVNQEEDISAITENLPRDMVLEDFLEMTPRKYREMTGERLGFGNTLKLKAAQRFVKREMRQGKDADISPGLYVVMAIFGLGWLAMGLMDDWDGNNWVVNLLLTILCWLPGLIHALVKQNEYY